MYDHGKALRTLMAEKNTSNKELAEFCNVKSEQVSIWRNNTMPNIGFKSLEKLCRFFNIGLSEFIKRGE